VLIAMKGLSARGLCRCKARATSSLPEPDSPVIKTVACDSGKTADGAKHFLHGRRLAENLRHQPLFL
jgi:hypothetical protein